MATILEGPPPSNYIRPTTMGSLMHEALLRRQQLQKIAIIDASTDKEITRDELLEQTIRVAVNLKKHGLKQGDLITILSENSPKLVIVLLAAYFNGITVNLLNPDYTSREVELFISLCKPKMIFCSSKAYDTLYEIGLDSPPVINFEASSESSNSFEPFLQEVSQEERWHFKPVTEQDLDPTKDVALVMTSSGTTGFPKAVMLTHSNLRITLTYLGHPELGSFDPRQTTMAYLPMFHLLGTAVVMASILYCTKMVIMEKFIPNKFLELVQKHQVTQVFAVPPILLLLSKSPMVDDYDLSSLQDIASSAAPLKQELGERVKKRLNMKCVRQAYGFTEICGSVTILAKNDQNISSVGKVVEGHQLKVCDIVTGKTVGPKELGELRVKGESVMKGYLGDEQETKNAFDEDGYVKSGDLGYFDENEYVYIVDRLKDVIKYKGFQVAPAELESLLIQHSAIVDAAVIGKPDENAGELPMAFIVKNPEVKITEEAIVEYIKENASDEKQLRGGIRFVERIPKSPAGKILRRKLKELAGFQ